ncbi:MAG: 6-aminohexanoate hydrolase, partial [Vitreimonas sp.]
MTDVLGDLDAVGVAEGIRRKDFTPQEALDAAIVRVEKLNPELNFMATKAYDYGRAAAAKPLAGPCAG